jgi:hypothetical protein
VSYFVRVTAGAGSLSSEVSVQLPIRVVNFISIDPIPSFAPPQATLLPKRPLESVEMGKRRSRSMDDVRAIRLARIVFESGGTAPGVGIIASDGTYRGDTTMHPIGRLEVRNFTPPEVLVRRAAEQRLQELALDLGPGTDAGEGSRYPHGRVATRSAVTNGGETQVQLQCIAHEREPQVCESAAQTPYFGDSSMEDSRERQPLSPDVERGAIPLTAYSSTATQRMYDVSQEPSHRRPLPTTASAYQHPTPRTPAPPGDTIDRSITSDEEVDILLSSVDPDDGSNVGVLQDPGVAVDGGETTADQTFNLQEKPLRKSLTRFRGPLDVPSPVESISRATSVRRPLQMGSQPLSERITQQSSESIDASSTQSSRATSTAGGVESRTSGSYSSHSSVSGPGIELSKPAQGRPVWSASAPVARKHPPNRGRAVTRMNQNIGPPFKGGPGGLVLQPRPLPTSRTAARRSVAEGGQRTSTTTLGLKSPPPGQTPQLIPQQACSSDRGSANASPSKKPKVSRLKITDLENKNDFTKPHACGKQYIGEDTVPSAPQTHHLPTSSEDPHFIPPTVSSLMRTDIQPGNTSTSILRGPRPAPERPPPRQAKSEESLEDVSRSAPPLTRQRESNSHTICLQQLDTTPTPPSRARQSTTSTPSNVLSLGPTSVKSRIAMLEEKTKTLDNMSGVIRGGRWSATSVGTGVSSRHCSVRPLSNASVGTFESGVSTYHEPGHVGDNTSSCGGMEEETIESDVEKGVIEGFPLRSIGITTNGASKVSR